MTFVLDASVTLCWLFLDGKPAARTYALGVLEAMQRPAAKAIVPVTWGLEISNVLGKAEIKGLLNEAQGGAFLEMLGSLEIAADQSTFTKALSETLQVARRYRLSSYDASYLELAMRSGVPLATLDQDLLKAAGKAGVRRFAA